MNGYEALEQALMGKDICIVIHTNGESVNDGHVDLEIYSGREPEQKNMIVQVFNAYSAERALKQGVALAEYKREQKESGVSA